MTTRPLRALIVEDSPDDADLLLRELRRGGYALTHERVDTAEDMSKALATRPWDIMFCDYSMPGFSAAAAMALAKRSGRDLPLIMVSGTVGEDAAVEAMRSGASDYLLKGNLTRLLPAVERELRESANRAEQKKMREQLLISDRLASVGTLAAGVAHEINNPLAVVLANLEFIEQLLASTELPVPVEIREPLKDARDATERVRLIVRDIKIFSRVDEHRTDRVDLQRVIESSARMAWNEIRHRARLIKDFGDVPHVEANDARLGQVFLNLIVNAAQAIPEGKAEQNEIRVVTRTDASGRPVVEIRDTGCGIPDDHLAHIFEPFFTTKPIGVGTGLGLAICHQIITDLGGEISVTSAVGKGTVFRVLLPRATDASAAAPAPVVTPRPALRRGRVLVVDDEPMMSAVMNRMLGAEHDVRVMASAKEALDHIAAQEPIDVILCDLMMPQMTGADFFRAVETLAPHLIDKIIFMTGGAFTPGAREFLARIANPPLEKPFDLLHLRSLVNERVK